MTAHGEEGGSLSAVPPLRASELQIFFFFKQCPFDIMFTKLRLTPKSKPTGVLQVHVAGLKGQKACAAKFQPGEDYEHCVEGTNVPLGL